MSHSEDKDYWILVEPYWEVVSIHNGPDVFLSGLSAIPIASQCLFASHWTQSEVRNGGFSQYFYNSTGVLAPEAVEAFRVLGMPEAARIINEAMSSFGMPYPRDRDARYEKILSFPETKIVELGNGEYATSDDRFRPLDERFWRCMDEEAGGFDAAADRYALNARKQ